jgi:hypothetical protein
MASFTPVDVVRLAAVSRLRIPNENVQPVADAITTHLASAEPMLRADQPDVNPAPVFLRGLLVFPGGAL